MSYIKNIEKRRKTEGGAGIYSQAGTTTASLHRQTGNPLAIVMQSSDCAIGKQRMDTRDSLRAGKMRQVAIKVASCSPPLVAVILL